MTSTPRFKKLDYEKIGFFPTERLVEAVNAAIALRRPLLLTGEPGSGKTRVGEVVAELLTGKKPEEGKSLESFHVKSESRASHLLYRYDAQARFADSYTPGGGDPPKDVRHYIESEPLGRALLKPGPVVFLCDEIDKAPKDFCNDLLDVVDKRRFDVLEVPLDADGSGPKLEGHPIRRKMKREDLTGAGSFCDWSPVIVITSNSERLLPQPFLRRTIFCHMDFPTGDELKRILESRFAARKPPDALLKKAIRVLLALRAPELNLSKKPTSAELIDFMELCLDSEPVGWKVQEAGDQLASRARDLTRQGSIWKSLPYLGALIKAEQDFKKLTQSSEE